MPTTFANSINSNPIYAERAEKDAAGNTISTTYATKAELPEGVPTVTSSDNGKVLQASYSGGTGSVSWVSPSGGTTYTAGNMISLANDAIAVSTTAGVTDIQQVASLPASPVATVLYLIPET